MVKFVKQNLILSVDWIFAVAVALLIIFFAALTELASTARITKQILGAATTGLAQLQSEDLETARLQLEQVRLAVEQSKALWNAEEIVTAGNHLVRALELLNRPNQLAGSFQWDSASNSSSQQFYKELKLARKIWLDAKHEIAAAQNLLAGLPLRLLPQDWQARAEDGLEFLRLGQNAVNSAVDLSSLVLQLLSGEPKTYLLIFQNNNEARATGGFIGTYGILRLGNGTMKIEKIESVYAADGQLREMIAAPGPMQRFVTPLWGMRDSNWFVDFPTSARKTLEFLEKETGVLAEGVISFTPDIFEEILAITGPVEMPEYGETLTSGNFRQRVQYRTSIDYDRQLNEPKKFLADFAPRLLVKLASVPEEERLKILEIFFNAVAEKQFLMFSLDSEIQSGILGLGAGGELKRTAGDYLAIIHSNVGGGKTDLGIEQSVAKTVRIDAQGRQFVNLKITRTHKATNEIYLPNNLDFMRILVPDGSQLMTATGFDGEPLGSSSRPGAATDRDLAFWDANIKRDWRTGVYIGREGEYTAFMGWLTLVPGQTKTVEFDYVLPNLAKQYSQLLQKQPGAREFAFKLRIEGADRPVLVYPKSWEGVVDTDQLYVIAGP